MKMEVPIEEMKKSGSRFQVARVNTKDEDAGDFDIVIGDSAVDRTGKIQQNKSNDQVARSPDRPKVDTNVANSNLRGSVSNGPESPCATFSVSGDSLPSRGSLDGYSKTNCAMNTIEALPCVDHYRNIFSATGGGIRARPTLAELHEELVRACSYLFFKFKITNKMRKNRRRSSIYRNLHFGTIFTQTYKIWVNVFYPYLVSLYKC